MKSPWDNNYSYDNKFPKFSNDFFKWKPDFLNAKVIALILAGLSILWLLSGLYSVKEGEEALVIRFGAFNRKADTGLNYHLPMPFEQVIIEKVNKSRRIEIGYRSSESAGYKNLPNSEDNPEERIKSVPQESIMLSGDENILYLNCDVVWHIKNLYDYTFNVINPEHTIKLAVESSIREVIGKSYISSVLSSQKQEIADEIEQLAQKILDNYGAGVVIDKVQLLKAEPPSQVISYYRDVQTAKADREKLINQSYTYMNEVIPNARGDAVKIIQEAEAYKQEVIAKASGDGQRFTLVLQQYLTNKQLTQNRLYFETIQDILKGSNKTVIGSSQVLPHLPVTQKNQ
ncbi:MAG: FtsH protease activity modulator HflK [Rickettsiaceae bacterium]|nr:FtsH protease activity modulator HflK [Rickettsiaceae bacterium]